MKRKIALVLVIITVLASSLIGVQAAKKVKLNKSKTTIKVGQTVLLKVKNTKKKVKWKSSNKNVAAVSKKGKVKGKKVGKATIIAKVGKKKLRCKIKVASSNTYSKNYTPTKKNSNFKTSIPVESLNEFEWECKINSDKTVSIVKYKGKKSQIAFAGEYCGYPVTTIGSAAFSDCNIITNLVIPNSVTSIETGAFIKCTNLRSIEIPSSIRNIGGHAFDGCENLSSIAIPYGIEIIGQDTFANCTGLRSITIPNSVKRIESSAFSGCKNLSEFTMPDSVTFIGASVFYHCSSLRSCRLSNNIKILQAGTFSSCTSLASITIPNGVTTIGSNAFYGCVSLNTITIPNSVDVIQGAAFKNCTNLKKITIMNSGTAIQGTPIPSGVVIKAPINSYAKQYADANGNPFERL